MKDRFSRGASILFLFVIVLAGCNRSRKTASATNAEMSASEYEVLSAWLDDKIAQKTRDTHLDQFVVYSETDLRKDRLLRDDNGQPIPWEKAAQSLREKVPALQQETLDSFRKANAVQATIRPSFHPAIHCQIVTPMQVEPIFKRGGSSWLGYYKQFPGSQGILTFSRVGFSSDGTQASFFFDNICGGLCGGASYVVMHRHNGGWKTDREISMWVY